MQSSVAAEARPKTTSQWLFSELKTAIISGEYSPGEPLGQEELAERYQVSRMPVREAIRLLEAEGLVEQRPHRCAVVAELDADDALELFEIRATLEMLGIQRSFPNLTDQQIRAIEQAHAALERTHPEDAIARHRAFHLALYAAAGQRLQKMIGEQLDAAQRYHLRFGRPGMEVSEQDREEHIALVESARTHDVAKAIAIMESHVGGGGAMIAQSIAEHAKPVPHEG